MRILPADLPALDSYANLQALLEAHQAAWRCVYRLDGLGLLGEATATVATSPHALAERNGNMTSVMRGVD